MEFHDLATLGAVVVSNGITIAIVKNDIKWLKEWRSEIKAEINLMWTKLHNHTH